MTDAALAEEPRLYFIGYRHNNDDLDLIVEAFSPEQAVLLWRHWLIDEEETVPDHLFLFPLPSGHARVLDWHGLIIDFNMQPIAIPSPTQIAVWRKQHPDAAPRPEDPT